MTIYYSSASFCKEPIVFNKRILLSAFLSVFESLILIYEMDTVRFRTKQKCATKKFAYL